MTLRSIASEISNRAFFIGGMAFMGGIQGTMAYTFLRDVAESAPQCQNVMCGISMIPGGAIGGFTAFVTSLAVICSIKAAVLGLDSLEPRPAPAPAP